MRMVHLVASRTSVAGIAATRLDAELVRSVFSSLVCLEDFGDECCDLRSVPEVVIADVIHIHDCLNVVKDPGNRALLQKKKLVLTLSGDMAPLTGGCTDPGDCRRYERFCHNCPQREPDPVEDVAQKIWLAKYEVLRHLEITVVATTAEFASRIRRSGLFCRFPIRVIPPAVPVDIYQPYPKEAVRRVLGVPETHRLVLVGGVGGSDGNGFVCGLLSALSVDRRRFLTVLLLGGAVGESEVVGVRVKGLGCLSNEENLAMILSAADGLILGSAESPDAPDLMRAALACGTPVVAPAAGCSVETVVHGETGFLAGSGNAADLVMGIEWCLALHGEELGTRCRDHALASFSPAAQARAFLDVAASPHPPRRVATAPGFSLARISAILPPTGSDTVSLEKCLADLSGQTAAPVMEVVVVVPSADDRVAAVLDRFRGCFNRVVSVEVTDSSRAAALDMAVRAAEGTYVIHLAVHDRLAATACEAMMRVLDEEPDVGLVFGDSYMTHVSGGTFLEHSLCGVARWPDYSPSLHRLYWPVMGAHPMWRKTAHWRAGGCEPSCGEMAEQELWLKIGERYPVRHLPMFTELCLAGNHVEVRECRL